MAPQRRDESASEEVYLLRQVGAGDREAFRLLYARYSEPLFSLAIRMVGNMEVARELLQDAFVKIWRHASSYDPRLSRPFTWAVTIVRRTCIDHLRRVRAATPVEVQPEPGVAAVAPLADSPRQATIARENSERLRQGLADLPDPQRQALELALFSGLTHVEIATRLGQPVGTVKSWIRRGLLDLREKLNPSAS